MYNKKDPSLKGADALVFYAQRLKLIKEDLTFVDCIWRACERPKNTTIPNSDSHEEMLISCNKQSIDNPCQSCIENKKVSKEKRRLKSEFNRVLRKMLEFVPAFPARCYKIESTYVDLEFNKLGNS